MHPKQQTLQEIKGIKLPDDLIQWTHLYRLQGAAMTTLERFKLEEKFLSMLRPLLPEHTIGNRETILEHFMPWITVSEYGYRRHVCMACRKHSEVEAVLKIVDEGKIKLSTASRLVSNARRYALEYGVSQGEAILTLCQDLVEKGGKGVWARRELLLRHSAQ
jgi:hypothetical protein